MGLVDAKRIVTDAVEQYRDKMVSPFSRFLRGAPTFCTYFSQSKVESTASMGTQQVNAIIGANSPLRYNKIDDMVLYQFKQLNPNIDYAETGYQSDIISDCTILPETIIPVPNDLFIVGYLGKSYLFKVNKVNINIIESNNFYSIEYELYKTDWDMKDINVVDDFKFIYDNIGTDSKTILHCDTFTHIQDIEKIISKFRKYYIELFYKRYLNSFLYNAEDSIYYNKYITYFITKHELLTTFDDPIKLTMEVDMGRNFNRLYDKSIYNVITTRDITQLIYNDCIIGSINKPHSVMNMYKGNYKSLELSELELPDSFIYVGCISKNLINCIRDDNSDINTLCTLDKVIYEYIKLSEIISKETISVLDGYMCEDTFNDYCNIPIILYILKRNIELKKNYLSDTKDSLNRGGLGSI